ncbi:Uncharacterised protein [Cedecea lapagei]|uniref:Uncharacterized protein n=1 Tax=Cedecea lapagei TaxID=158823 RepID=A0A3S4IHU2_9ENTR|nr:hypothetical protein [Cedecea lapagei]VEB97313.1 Uncharacterised protein [Cedecea lapagei]VEB99988.1 Uncharacterised protein [Cedecea lapagei]
MSVIDINTVKIQRQIDERQREAIDSQIKQVEGLMVFLLSQREKLDERLGLNKPDGGDAA